MKRLFQNVKKINFTFLLLSILAILLLIVGYRSLTYDDKSSLRLEVVKFVLIGIVGGFVLQWYNGKRDKDKALNEFRKNILTNLTHTYNKIKKARRIIEKEFEDKYLFCWDEVPGNDSGRFIEFLKQEFGISWVETAKIEKIERLFNFFWFRSKNFKINQN